MAFGGKNMIHLLKGQNIWMWGRIFEDVPGSPYSGFLMFGTSESQAIYLGAKEHSSALKDASLCCRAQQSQITSPTKVILPVSMQSYQGQALFLCGVVYMQYTLVVVYSDCCGS